MTCSAIESRTSVGAVLAAAILTVLLPIGCEPTETASTPVEPATTAPPPPTTPVEPATEIWGISSLQVSGTTVRATKATSGKGRGLTLLVDGLGGQPMSETTLSIGDSFIMSDRRHVFTTYRLIRIEDGQAVLHMKHRSDARSFGSKVEETERIIRISSYSRE